MKTDKNKRKNTTNLVQNILLKIRDTNPIKIVKLEDLPKSLKNSFVDVMNWMESENKDCLLLSPNWKKTLKKGNK